MKSYTSTSLGSISRMGLVLLSGVTLACTGACSQSTSSGSVGSKSDSKSISRAPGPMISEAIAYIDGTENHQIRGTVKFTRETNGVRVVADIKGLSPGEHGFHIHENGSCSGNGSAAGGHFNPTHSPHGGRGAAQRHVGDLGNLTADADGHAQVDFVDDRLELSGMNMILGRSVIIHGDRDDLTSQPSGNSGPRIACGVILAFPNTPATGT